MSRGIKNIVNSLEAIRNLPPDVASVEGHSLGDAEVIAIASLRSLRELDLSGCDGITDHSVSRLRQVASLEELDLSFCNQITDASLLALAGLPALRFLNLNWCYGVTDSGLTGLGHCKSLEVVSLWSCEEVTDSGVEALAMLPSLRVLELPEFAAITDQALTVLSAKNTSLESLRLDHLNEISDEGLARLSGLKRLRSLTIEGCPKVTVDGVAALEKAIPGCQISFKT
jgi:DNA-binding Xre family transcriptional regulator